MALRIRRAQRTDVPALVSLLADDDLSRGREQAGSTIPDAYWRAFDAIDADDRQLLVAAELDGVIVGTLQLSFIPYLTYQGRERAQIEAVRVASASRGAGIGRRMLEWAIEQAHLRGCHLVQLTMDKRRTGARRFYESLGFEATHEGYKLPVDGART
jgi:GNAT superfamily N-acetyltransferase